ncbi:hypothetical protein TanjilG_00245 [Lupinus angustifolius]|uniref:RING-type domain-containing protein n=1 Tax=Lupinus angustifolius TaxID=3871 RepID=A0A394D428_LUPAN|nr:PREDICTED: putative E3 ubiquitin-protein ligase XBAT35 [Lupinus angustifolius]OIW17915.1 hypothetical protein TanjilG_00245 [Lupinus angustifolius]
MGQSQSKDELLYQQVIYGNVEGIKSLNREGAGLEWMDIEGKTPLIVACMNPELYNVAKTLIELGANVNAYRPGRHAGTGFNYFFGCHAGTPLHHAAKRGLESTVKLLLSHGANALVLNDDCQTALEVARAKGHTNVVRAFEVNPRFLHNDLAIVPPATPPAAEDPELAMAIHASLQHAINDRSPFPDAHPNFEASSSTGRNNTSKHGFVGTKNPNTSGSMNLHEAEQGGNNQHVQILENDILSDGHTTSGLDFNPSVPPVTVVVLVGGPIQYPSIDLSPSDTSSPVVDKKNADENSSSCVICLDAPAEGACIPCGHVAGCMSCLNEVKTKKLGCPVCRAKINQVIKLYHV